MFNIKLLRQHSVWIVLTHDVVAVILSWWIAFFVCYNLKTSSLPILEHGFKAQLWVVATHTFFYWRYKTYRPLWRFFSLPELFRLSKTIFYAWIVNISVLFMLHDLILIPKSIWFIYPLWLILILGLSRLAIRYASDKQIAAEQIKRVLIMGAGRGAELYLRELARWPEKQYQPIACLDDDITLKGKEIRGVPILGSADGLAHVVKNKQIDLVVIAIPSIHTHTLRKWVVQCENIGIPVRVLPSLSEFKDGQPIKMNPREVSLEDLLGRDPVELNWDGIRAFLQDEVVLVSGGGGSIGSELCFQILQMQPKKLIIVDHSEFNLYQVEKDLKDKGFENIVIKLVSVTDTVSIRYIMQKYQPTLVFHAAAYKHVPILEFQPFQAIKNNVIGTRILAEAAVECGVKKFVMVSSDKAVNPTNIMGGTKRIAEIFCQAFNHVSKTAFITVRFGNVIGSTGSVIPLFKKQIAAGGPVTITHPEMTRYFMTIKEASQLILQAGFQGNGGEIFVLDMGQPVKIIELARHLIKLSEKSIDKIGIVYTGLRPGEKMYEELFYDKEALSKTEQKKIFKANGQLKKSWNDIYASLSELETCCLDLDEERLICIMRHILENEGMHLQKVGNRHFASV